MCWCWSGKSASNALLPRLLANTINPGAGHCSSASGLFPGTDELTRGALRASVVALDDTTRASYRQVIPFTLGTQRARAIWHPCQVFFDSEFVEIVDEKTEGESANRVLAGIRCCGVVTQAWGRSV
ncbi:protein of unknown function [uncultured Woeseiaceae bacterium]|uniref:Uncharacterized protein n=1 Tax=uncultured Woeseiaceae bacterium TaxID=1983305 RepID=A0A7D9D1K8_9GAMM|nr:protein of unknown function [uncultured Woeseiaceae bacterium]